MEHRNCTKESKRKRKENQMNKEFNPNAPDIYPLTVVVDRCMGVYSVTDVILDLAHKL